MKRPRILLLAVLLAMPIAWAHADGDNEMFRFREPARVQDGQEVTSVVTIGSPIQVYGTVRENAVSVGGDVFLGPNGAIEGDAVAVGGHVIQSPGSHIGGKVTSLPFSMGRVRRAIAIAIPTLAVGMGLVTGAAIVLGSLGSVALAVIVLLLFPGQTAAAREQIERHPGKTMLFGFLGVLMAIPVLIFLLITIIGIPLAFLTAACLMAAIILGTVALGQWIGLRIAQQFGRAMPPFLAGLVGLFVLTLLAALPYLGALIQGLIACTALGSVAFSRFRSVSVYHRE